MKPSVTHSHTNNRTKPKLSLLKEEVLAVVVLLLVCGSILLAFMDPGTRPTFADLTKFALGAYMGLLIPRDK